MPLTRQELESSLWGAADILRGQIDSSDYKNYIFSILFLKRLSDRFDEEVEAAVGAGLSRELAMTDRDEHEFFVPEDARWLALMSASMNRGEALNVASYAIEEANAPRLDGVLTNTNWNDESKLGSPANRENIITKLLNHFAALDLRDANLSEDDGGSNNVLGDAYEYLINRFADDAGKKGGEFYTPRSVVRLIVELLQPQERMRICESHGRFRRHAHLCRRVRPGAERRRPQLGAARAGAEPGHSRYRQAQPAATRAACRSPRAGRRHRGAAPDGPEWQAVFVRPGHRQSSLQPEETGGRSLRRATRTIGLTATGPSHPGPRGTWGSCCTCWR